METILIICSVTVTIAAVVAVVFLALALSQVRRTAREAEIFLRSVNTELAAIGRITGSISAFVDRFTSPWVKIGGWFTGMASSFFIKHRQEKKTKENVEREPA